MHLFIIVKYLTWGSWEKAFWHLELRLFLLSTSSYRLQNIILPNSKELQFGWQSNKMRCWNESQFKQKVQPSSKAYGCSWSDRHWLLHFYHQKLYPNIQADEERRTNWLLEEAFKWTGFIIFLYFIVLHSLVFYLYFSLVVAFAFSICKAHWIASVGKKNSIM